jgi:hypothetical protein
MALIDGEAVVRQVDGRSNFEALMTKRGGAQASRGLPPAHDDPGRRPTDRARLCGCDRRSLAHSPIPRHRRLFGLGPQAVSVWGNRLRRRHLEVRDRRTRTLLYEAANVMLTRYKGQLKLKDWAFAIAKRSTMRKARVALARRLAIIMHAMLREGTEFASA